MFKINPLILLGGILILIGIFGPWISLFSHWVYEDETSHLYGTTKAKMSPFTSTYTLRVLPNNTVLRSGSYSYYDSTASLIGIACIIGTTLGFLGQSIDRWKITSIGGALSLISTLSFLLCIPANITIMSFKLMPHWYLTILGTVLIIFSPGLRLLESHDSRTSEE